MPDADQPAEAQGLLTHQDEDPTQDVHLLLDDEEDRPKGSTVWQGYLSMAKSSIGAGSFALPWALSQAGVFLGALGLVVISLVSLYTMKLMIETKRMVNRHRKAQQETTLAETYVEVADTLIPRYGPLLVQLAVIITTSGVAAGYLVFIGLNLRVALLNLLNWDLSLWEIYAVVLPIVVLLTFLPSFKSLAKAVYAGTVFLIFAFVFSIVSAIQGGNFPHLNQLHAWKFDTFPLFAGIAVFLFGVHAMVIPLEQDLKQPRKINSVFNAACATVLLINLPFAVFGYSAFGSDIKPYVFCNFPRNKLLGIVQFALCLELIFSIPLVLLPGPLIIEEWLGIPQFARNMKDSIKQNLIRALIVLCAWGFAVAVPIFETILSLVGGLSGTMIAFVLPVLFNLIAIRKHKEESFKSLRTLWHFVLLAFGLLIVVSTTYLNIRGLIDDYRHDRIQGVFAKASSNGGTC